MSKEFLHRLPILIEQKQRIIYESIGIASDIIDIIYEEIYRISNSVIVRGTSNPSFKDNERMFVISASWGIIDQADLIRQLIHSRDSKLDFEASRQFMTMCAPVRGVRNKMDHLPGHIDNYLKAARPLPPAHGALSFTWRTEAEKEHGWPSSYRTIVVLGASMHRDLQVHGVPYLYEDMEVPLDHFTFQAFGEVIPLKPLADAARAVANELGEVLERDIGKFAAKIAAERGLDIAELMAPPEVVAGTLTMTATYNDGASNTDNATETD